MDGSLQDIQTVIEAKDCEMEHHVCAACYKRFATKNSLRKHLLLCEPKKLFGEMEPSVSESMCHVAENNHIENTAEDSVEETNYPIENKQSAQSAFKNKDFVATQQLLNSPPLCSIVKTENVFNSEQNFCEKKPFVFETADKIAENNLQKQAKRLLGKCNQTVFFTNDENPALNLGLYNSDKPYKCTVCDKSYKDRKSLKVHYRTHSGEKPFQCDLCDKAFSQRPGLKSHYRIHTGEKPYKCDLCNKSFSQKTGLNSHYRSHTGEKPYKCDQCDKAFSQQAVLNRHYRIHTGEKPYECKKCDKAFSLLEMFKMHLMTVHGEQELHKCDMCNKGFNKKYNLKRHILTHTGEKPQPGEKLDPLMLNQQDGIGTIKIENSEERLFVCAACNEIYDTEELLAKHFLCEKAEPVVKREVCEISDDEPSTTIDSDVKSEN